MYNATTMKILKRRSHKLIIAALIIIPLLLGITASFIKSPGKQLTSPLVQQSPTPTPDEPFRSYSAPTIPKKDVYIIFMVGDSMTEALGAYGGKLNEFINELYESTPGNQRIVIDNYAKGATNLLGLQDAMKQKVTVGDKVLDPLLERKFDLILIESFGYNPLSQLGIEEGLKKQTQILDEVMKLLTRTHPDAAVIFVATIAPHKATYAQGTAPGKTIAQRTAEAEERMEYIKNHIAYAKEHNIPIIDIYNKSLKPNGDGNPVYINPNDDIHPSFAGVDFISHEIANFIYGSQILPK
jgi:lysophospholipase L1-like esterase